MLVISGSSTGCPLRRTLGDGVSSVWVKRVVDAQLFELVGKLCLHTRDRYIPDRAILVAQVDHAQIGQSRQRQARDLTHRRAWVQ